MDKKHIHGALAVLAVYAICSFVQKNVMQVPVIGTYLPGGQ
ncbi:MAG: hypothetical protein QM625_22700 [Ralstonia sp.]|nr:hypothetical protein [Ralstonia pickettii]